MSRLSTISGSRNKVGIQQYESHLHLLFDGFSNTALTFPSQKVYYVGHATVTVNFLALFSPLFCSFNVRDQS